MTMPTVRLELVWPGKENIPKLEPRVLLEDIAYSHHAFRRVSDDDIFDNLLIHGDNLLALKALEQHYAGKVKCVYIDPPYNTGSAFEHYDDGIEHSIWLSLMKERLKLLCTLLSENGIIFISIDDTEMPYLSVLMDEIFGRKNACGTIIWEKKKKPSFLNSNMGVVTEYILSYAKERRKSPPFIGGKTTENKKYPFNNAGNGIRVLRFPAGSVVFRCSDRTFKPQDMSDGNIITRLLDEFSVRDGRNVQDFRLEGEWRYSQNKLNEIVAAGEQILISKIPFRPNHIKEGGEPKKLKNLFSIAHYGMSTYEDATEESRKLFGTQGAFDYPKPELLIQTLLNAVTEPGDLVLDSFLGSGTTAAVAHKMGRRWIGVELGNHAITHCVPRLKKVIDGQDPDGVTETTGWKGGGGFRFFRLASSLLEKDRWGNWVISKKYNSAMLAEALCKLEGFTYSPSDTVFWQHGYSTERDYIYVTTQTLSGDQLRQISDEVGGERSLLVFCSAFRAKVDSFTNLTVKKIPAAVLTKCEWGHDDYSLQVSNLPMAEDLPAGNGEKKKGRKPKTMQDLPLLALGMDKKGCDE